jgi:NDP-sugar pyrophosphorylase family protein
VDAVVMAAGEGRRLRPLTERWPKPILPIEGRPVIVTLLHELAAAGLTRVWVVVGHLGAQVERLLGDGSAFGVELRYARQAEQVGSADAVRAGLDAGATPPLAILGADTVFTAGTVGSVVDRWRAAGTAGAIAVRAVPNDELPERSSVRVEGDRLVAVVEKPPAGTAGRLAGAPLWILGPDILPFFDELPGPPYELATVAQRALAAGLELSALEIGPTRDLTRPEDLVERNFPYLWSTR